MTRSMASRSASIYSASLRRWRPLFSTGHHFRFPMRACTSSGGAFPRVEADATVFQLDRAEVGLRTSRYLGRHHHRSPPALCLRSLRLRVAPVGLPVARRLRMKGSLTRARAIATCCCSPLKMPQSGCLGC